MKKAGVYMNKESGSIWICEKVEYYPKSVRTNSKEFSIVVSGSVGGSLGSIQQINRCLITGNQYKKFYRVGDL